MNSFYAYLNRMKHIERWSLMHSTQRENVSEHTQNVSILAHALALIQNTYFSPAVDEYKVLCMALYHECSEVITGDLPTPIKYFNERITSAYKDLEGIANEQLLGKVPDELAAIYRPMLSPEGDSLERKLVKAADKLSAYIKCIEELKSGNREFQMASETISADIEAFELPAVQYFAEHFLPSFRLTLDELNRN